jgi:hypothetical protein
MMPSRLIDNRTRRHQSRWSVTSNAAGRDTGLDSTPRVAPILSPAAQSATAPSRLHLRLPANQLLRLCRATLLHSQAVAKSP